MSSKKLKTNNSDKANAVNGVIVDPLHTTDSGLKDLDFDDAKRWHVIYPIYIDTSKSTDEGRRVTRKYAIEYPTVMDIAEVCSKQLHLQCKVEAKCYSRDFTQRGRVRVCLKKQDESLVNKNIPNKLTLLKLLCVSIPKLSSRAQNIATLKKYHAEITADETFFMTTKEEKAAQAASQKALGNDDTDASKKDKKKGKKKGRK